MGVHFIFVVFVRRKKNKKQKEGRKFLKKIENEKRKVEKKRCLVLIKGLRRIKKVISVVASV